MNQKKLSFIIVNYATKGLIEKNITNLLNSWSNCEVIFVDSDSPDGSADYVEKRFGKDPRVILIRSQNLQFRFKKSFRGLLYLSWN